MDAEIVNTNDALTLIEQHELYGAKIKIHPSRMSDIKQLQIDEDIDGSIRAACEKYMRDYLRHDMR